MSKFKVGDRAVVVRDDMAFGYWVGRRGEVTDPNTGLSLSVRVHFDDGSFACFREDELEFEHVYDELSKEPTDEAPPSGTKLDKRPEFLEEVVPQEPFAVDWSKLLVVEESDDVNHPPHYADGWSNGAEVIDITENLNFNRGNAVKYLSRAGKKGGPEKELEDIQKALWYVTREIERLGGTH